MRDAGLWLQRSSICRTPREITRWKTTSALLASCVAAPDSVRLHQTGVAQEMETLRKDLMLPVPSRVGPAVMRCPAAVSSTRVHKSNAYGACGGSDEPSEVAVSRQKVAVGD